MLKNLNRSSLFFITTLLIGAISVVAIQYFDNGGVVEFETPTEKATKDVDIYGDLQNKVRALRSGPFIPLNFEVIEGSISGYLTAELITLPAANDLKNDLNKIFADRVYNQCELFLRSNNNNSAQVKTWLNLLQSKIGTNNKINTYRRQISLYKYYSETLPNEVKSFVKSGVANYEEEIYQRLKNEVQNMPNFNPSYKNSQKFRSISKSLMDDLFLYNYNANN